MANSLAVGSNSNSTRAPSAGSNKTSDPDDSNHQNKENSNPHTFNHLSIAEAYDFMRLLQGIRYEKTKDKNSKYYKLYNKGQSTVSKAGMSESLHLTESQFDTEYDSREEFDLIDENGGLLLLHSQENTLVKNLLNKPLSRENNKFVLCKVVYSLTTGEIKEILPLWVWGGKWLRVMTNITLKIR